MFGLWVDRTLWIALLTVVVAFSLASCIGSGEQGAVEQSPGDSERGLPATTALPTTSGLVSSPVMPDASLTDRSTPEPSPAVSTPSPGRTPSLAPTPEPPPLGSFENWRRMAQEYPALASAFEQLGWIEDGIEGTEARAIGSLLGIAIERPPDGASLVFLDWVQDGIDDDMEAASLEMLAEIAGKPSHLVSYLLSLPWVRDGLEEQETVAIVLLNDIEDVEVAAYAATLGWMRDGIGDGGEIDVLGRLSEIAGEDVELALSVMSLTWVQDGIDGTDGRLVVRFADMAGRDVAFAREMASLGWIRDGIGGDTEIEAFEELSYLAFKESGPGSAVVSLEWVQDGIGSAVEVDTIRQMSFIANEDSSLAQSIVSLEWMRDDINALEAAVVKGIRSVSDVGIAQEIASLGWVQDGIDDDAEVATIERLSYISYNDVVLAASLISLGWVQDGIHGEAEGDTIKHLSHLANEDIGLAQVVVSLGWMQDNLDALEEGAVNSIQKTMGAEPPWAILSLRWVQDGIDDDTEVTTIQHLSYASLQDIWIAQAMVSLEWVQDDTDILEAEALALLGRTASLDPVIASSALSLGWVQDGIDGELEVDALGELYEVSYRDAEAALAILAMPFLESVEPPDVAAMRNLRLMAGSESGEMFQRVMASPLVRGGITDELAPVVGILSGLAKANTSLIDALLDPNRVLVEMRNISLPFSGEVALAIIRTREGVPRSMDILEGAVRNIESMMKAPLPTRYIGLLYGDAVPRYSSGVHSGTHIAIRPEYDVDDDSEESEAAGHLIAHELAHYYWTGSADWVDEGVAELVATLVEHDRAGHPIEARNWPCPSMRTIAELEALSPTQDDDAFPCNYSLGERFFLDLLRGHGEEQFLTGLRELYAMSQIEEDDASGYSRVSLGVDHIQEAFGSDDGTTDEVIARWYEGTEPYDLSHLVLSPTDSSLPGINGRVERAYLSGEDIVGWRLFTLEYSYELSQGRVEVPIEIVERYEDGFVVRQRSSHLTADSGRTRRMERLYLGPPPGVDWWPAGSYVLRVYQGNRVIAEVEYEVAPMVVG